MTNVFTRAAAAALLVGAASCRGAAPEAVPVSAPAAAPAQAAAPARYNEGDVQFMHGMIAHHRQALEMTALVPDRSTREDVRMLARRIELSQDDEIGMMERWLTRHGAPLPDEHAHHAPAGDGHASMPGMLTPEEMARLAAARGADFDRVFLESMIRHHEGALVMVDRLFSTPGAGQQSEVFQMASHIASDQRVEIARMHGLLLAGR